MISMVAIQALLGQRQLFSSIARGDWRPVASAAAGALLCGIFWEMWNSYSYAKWVYEVPYIYRFKYFEMPALGMAGYLPFGLECMALGFLIFKPRDLEPASQGKTEQNQSAD